MNDATLRRLHEIERELAVIGRSEPDPVWRALIERARDVIGAAAFGPAKAVHHRPPPPGLP